MDALYVNPGGDGSSGELGSAVRAGYAANFAAIVEALTNSRTVTGIDSITQDDDNAFIIFNSVSDFDFTLDQLTAGSKASFVNIGAGDVTFTNGSGVTVLGNEILSGASGDLYPTAIVYYHTMTSPRVIQGGAGSGGGTGDVVGPASSTDGTPALYNGTTGKLLKTGIVPVANGGTGTATPGLTAGVNIDSITGSWPGQTINALTLGRASCAVVSGTMTLDLGSKQQKKFENTTVLSSGFTMAFTNATNIEVFTVILYITGSVAIVMPSTVVMETDDLRWNNSTKTLTIVGATGSPVTLSFNKMNALYDLRAGSPQYAS